MKVMGHVAERGSLYMVYAALLVGSLWSGGYFHVPKWVMITMLLAAGAWELAVWLQHRRRWALRSPAFWILSAFAVFAAAGVAWSVAPADTIREVLLLCGYLAALLVVLSQARRYRGTAADAAAWLVYAAAFIAAWGAGAYILRAQPYTLLIENTYRAGSTFEYSNALSCFCLMALPLTFALLARAAERDRPLFAAAAALQVTAVILAFSRLGIVMLAVISIFFILGFRRSLMLPVLMSLAFGALAAGLAVALTGAQQQAAAVAAVAALVLAACLGQLLAAAMRGRAARAATAAAVPVLALAAFVFLARWSDRLDSVITQRFRYGIALSKLLPHRLDTYSGAEDAFHVHPLAGTGLGSFAQVYQSYAIASYTKFAHNIVLQTAVETGVIGAVLFTAFLLYVTGLSIWRLLTGPGLVSRGFAVSSLVFIVYNMVDWEWYIPALTAWFMVTVACLEAGDDEQPGGEPAL